MLKNSIVIFLLCVLAIACDGSGKMKKPDNLIPKEKMADILYDLYIVNAAKGVNRKLLEKNDFVPETYILTKHNIDSLQFASSNTYYAFNTEIYKGIVEKVKARLEKEKKTYEDLREKEGEAAKKIKDSIKAQTKKRKDSTKKVIDTISVN